MSEEVKSLSVDERAAAMALHDAAEAGPWRWDDCPDRKAAWGQLMYSLWSEPGEGPIILGTTIAVSGETFPMLMIEPANAAFIAAACQLVPRYEATVRELETERQQVHSAHIDGWNARMLDEPNQRNPYHELITLKRDLPSVRTTAWQAGWSHADTLIARNRLRAEVAHLQAELANLRAVLDGGAAQQPTYEQGKGMLLDLDTNAADGDMLGCDAAPPGRTNGQVIEGSGIVGGLKMSMRDQGC